ncbi:MAG: hypothetical protein QOE97_3401 [Pseudonocardiales bacterium]|nr:hypothetical protein [Pseudonocardiales bacterium]
MTGYLAQYAWLPTGLARDVRIEVAGGRILTVTTNAPAEPGDGRLDGVTLPGFANTHSHAFHRALRGRLSDAGGTFWSWRERMYALAERLDPDRYFTLARAVFAEMALSGVSCVGEFHYLHHAPGGRPYADPNAMGVALARAAAEAGIRVTLLDTCYLADGFWSSGPLRATQARFGDLTAEGWAHRVAGLRLPSHARVGAAIHSVRAVPRHAIPTVVAAAADGPLHVHLSEQPAENEQCLAATGLTPSALLAECGALGPNTTAVHATHLTPADVGLLGSSGTSVSMCPTTERDLADGIGPARWLRDAGCPVVLGTDQHSMIDLLEEARALEMDERLASLHRGRFSVDELVTALTTDGHRSLGWADAGRIEPGARADLTTVRLDSVRTAGTDPAHAVLAASAADVTSVVVDGREIVVNGRHVLGDVGRLLAEAIQPLWA